MDTLNETGAPGVPAAKMAWFAAIVPVVITIALAAAHARDTVIPMDEGLLLEYPVRFLAGAIPHRDFATVYGPATEWVLGGAFFLFGPGVLVERIVGSLYHLAIVLAIFMIALRRGPVIAMICATLAALLMASLGDCAFALLGTIACVAWGLALLGGPHQTNGITVLAGFLMGAAALFRIEWLPVAFVLALPQLYHAPVTERRLFAGGFACALLLLALHVAVASPFAVFDNVIIDAIVRSGPGRRLALPPHGAIDKALLMLDVVAPILAAGSWYWAKKRGGNARALSQYLALALLGAALIPQALQRADRWHMLYAAAASVALLPLFIAELAGKRNGILQNARPRDIAVVAAILAILAYPAYRVLHKHLKLTMLRGAAQSSPVTNDGRLCYVDGSVSQRNLTMLLAKIDAVSRPGARVFVGPYDMRRDNYNDTFLYFLLPKLIPASYYMELNPLTANRADSGLARDVASADYLILDSRLDADTENNASQRYGSDAPNQVVRQKFKLIGRYGNWRLYAQKPGLAHYRPASHRQSDGQQSARF